MNCLWQHIAKIRKIYCLVFKKLDQETLLCQTYLDDLQDSIWTILDHVILYWTILTILDTFVPLKTNIEHVRPFEQLLAVLEGFGQFWTILNHVRPVWTCLDLFGPV